MGQAAMAKIAYNIKMRDLKFWISTKVKCRPPDYI
jgi:hypothetical protein